MKCTVLPTYVAYIIEYITIIHHYNSNYYRLFCVAGWFINIHYSLYSELATAIAIPLTLLFTAVVFSVIFIAVSENEYLRKRMTCNGKCSLIPFANWE